MVKLFLMLLLLFAAVPESGLLTAFEMSGGTQTATYNQCIGFYNDLDEQSEEVKMISLGETGIGKPLNLVVIDRDKMFNADGARKLNKRILLINNGIHPGEPDGIDASMMLARNLVEDSVLHHLLDHVVVIIVPIYNVAGSLNQSATSRANQNGPDEYGFRGNELNLDLNRDFIKCDSREAQMFNEMFATWKPDVMIDTHVSDGADYQYTMTYVATQKDKLQPLLGNYESKQLIPALDSAMTKDGIRMCPYVDTKSETPDDGIVGFEDGPRYSTGYAALFNCIGFMSETHMLKPFDKRVNATYAFLKNMLSIVNRDFVLIGELKRTADALTQNQTQFPLQWKLNENDSTMMMFNGYTATYKPSNISGQPRLFYDRTKPYSKLIPFFNDYSQSKIIAAPMAYIVPQQYADVIHLMQLNGVAMHPLTSDEKIDVVVYYLNDFKTNTNAYENHYQHSNTTVTRDTQSIQFYKGDMVVAVDQTCNRYIVETLEPESPDSYFNWNFFDGVLMQKEYFSSYVWEDRADSLLHHDHQLKTEFDEAKKQDTALNNNGDAQLEWIYNHSDYHEKSFRRYPVARVEWKMKID